MSKKMKVFRTNKAATLCSLTLNNNLLNDCSFLCNCYVCVEKHTQWNMIKKYIFQKIKIAEKPPKEIRGRLDRDTIETICVRKMTILTYPRWLCAFRNVCTTPWFFSRSYFEMIRQKVQLRSRLWTVFIRKTPLFFGANMPTVVLFFTVYNIVFTHVHYIR